MKLRNHADAEEGSYYILQGITFMETEKAAMGKYKEHPKYNVLSIRVTDEERAFIGEIQHHTQKSISKLMREAVFGYIKFYM